MLFFHFFLELSTTQTQKDENLIKIIISVNAWCAHTIFPFIFHHNFIPDRFHYKSYINLSFTHLPRIILRACNCPQSDSLVNPKITEHIYLLKGIVCATSFLPESFPLLFVLIKSLPEWDIKVSHISTLSVVFGGFGRDWVGGESLGKEYSLFISKTKRHIPRACNSRVTFAHLSSSPISCSHSAPFKFWLLLRPPLLGCRMLLYFVFWWLPGDSAIWSIKKNRHTTFRRLIWEGAASATL